MAKLLVADKTYTPVLKDTLNSICAAQCPDLTWKDVALFNWGTAEPVEVNRALFEIVGCSRLEDSPGTTVLDPKGTTIDIVIPKIWTGKAEFDKLSTIKVKKKIPAPAVSIATLDKWFIPKTERCDVRYQLEGPATSADKLALEVYGSNYCSATAWNNGLGTYAAVDEPVYKRLPGEIEISERSSGKIGDWKGESNAVNGMLKGQDRLLNVAFSPYNVMFRYYKDDGDQNARLTIQPFWPEFDVATVGNPVVAASLKIDWVISNIARLTNGTLVVVDREDNVIYRRALPAAKLGGGAQTINDWDGTYNWDHENDCARGPGAPKVNIDGMPYRVQIQAHTAVGDGNGVALAAMHTEVRLYVHPRTHFASEESYDPSTDPQSFAFALSEFIPDDDPVVANPGGAAAGAVARKYAQYQLAKAGYHPGPVDGNDRPAFQVAMKEFKRSRPKRRVGRGDYVRFSPVDASIGGDEIDALEDLPEGYLAWFAESAEGGDGPGDLSDLKNEKAFKTLQDPTEKLNIWVDDRQYYDTTGVAAVDGDAAALGNTRGGMSIGDAKSTRDGECIPRPWIPLRIQLPLLGRGRGLADELSDSELKKCVQPDAVGPVRVDWSFDEAGPDVSNIPAGYKDPSLAGQIRSRRFVSWTLDSLKENAYERKDLKRDVDYTNCPAANGGIRPSTGAIATYFDKAFGLGDEGLQPWYSGQDAAHDCIVTVAHSNWGGDVQTNAQLFPKALGAAGAYFNPSNIAGDGYRVRARVRFSDGGGFTFANHAALEARYPKAPQANTAKMRVWRKGTLRGYIRWTAKSTGNWPRLAGQSGIQQYYDAAHVHMIHADDKEESWGVKDLIDFSGTDADDIKALVENSLTTAAFTDQAYAGYAPPDFLKTQDKMTIDREYLWPWARARCFGWEEAIPAAVADNQIWPQFFDPQIFNVWRTFRMPLIFELLKRVEAKSGRMKGHLLVEFENAPKVWVARYWCNICGQGFRFLDRKKKAADAFGLPCPNPAGCTGRMTPRGAAGYIGRYVCDTCRVERTKKKDNNTGTAFDGEVCNRGFFRKCQGTLSAAISFIEAYLCAKCGLDVTIDEPNYRGGTHVGDACSDPNCQGIVQRQPGNWERYVCTVCPFTTEMPVGVVGHSSGVCGSCGKPLAHRTPGGPDLLGQTGKLSLGVAPPKPGSKPEGFTSFDGFGLPAVGSLCGSTWLFTSGEAVVWAHEMGHHRHLEHSANAFGYKNAQHDHCNNPAVTVGDAAEERQWDLHCLMNGYVMPSHPTREFDFPCGKCLLKQRGWQVEALGLPGAGVTD